MKMNMQIFGTKKCQHTRKAERYFKERAIPYHFVDLTVRGLSAGELSKVKSAVGLENLVDKTGKEYSMRNLKNMVSIKDEMLLNYPLLLKTPIVRNGPRVTIGYCPEIWKDWQ